MTVLVVFLLFIRCLYRAVGDFFCCSSVALFVVNLSFAWFVHWHIQLICCVIACFCCYCHQACQ